MVPQVWDGPRGVPAEMMATRGAAFSLVGHQEPFRCVGCNAELFFLAKGHGRFEPLA